MHISYLPFNRGAHPNYWSFKDNSPKGVTIHFIDNGIDTYIDFFGLKAAKKIFYKKGKANLIFAIFSLIFQATTRIYQQGGLNGVHLFFIFL